MVDLSIKCAGLKLKNPIIAAAGPNTKNYDIVKKGIDAGCGAIVVRGMHLKSLNEKPPSTREFWNIYHSDKTFRRGLYSFQSAAVKALRVNRDISPGVGGASPRPTLQEWTAEVKRMVHYAHEHNSLIITNIGWCGDYFPSEDLWKAEAIAMDKAGVDALELHTGPCPTVEPGRYLQADPEKYLRGPIKTIRKITNVPILVKLPIDCCDVISLAQMAEDAGADAIVPTARWMSINIDTGQERTSLWPGLMGYGGNWSVPILSAYIYRMRQRKPGTEKLGWKSSYEGQYYQKITIPIIASGGVSSGDDVVKLILAGANGVEICTQILVEGYGLVKRILKEMKEWMQKKEYYSPGDFSGIIRLVEPDQVDKVDQPMATVDEQLCNGCKKCIFPCTNEAIIFLEKINKAKVLVSKCEGCRTCYYICPQGAISFKESLENEVEKTKEWRN